MKGQILVLNSFGAGKGSQSVGLNNKTYNPEDQSAAQFECSFFEEWFPMPREFPFKMVGSKEFVQ